MKHVKIYEKYVCEDTVKLDLKQAFTMTDKQKKDEVKLLKKVEDEFEKLEALIKEESKRIGGDLLSPAIRGRAMQIIREKIKK